MGSGYYTGNGHIKVLFVLNGKDIVFSLYGCQDIFKIIKTIVLKQGVQFF